MVVVAPGGGVTATAIRALLRVPRRTVLDGVSVASWGGGWDLCRASFVAGSHTGQSVSEASSEMCASFFNAFKDVTSAFFTVSEGPVLPFLGEEFTYSFTPFATTKWDPPQSVTSLRVFVRQGISWSNSGGIDLPGRTGSDSPAKSSCLSK